MVLIEILCRERDHIVLVQYLNVVSVLTFPVLM